MELFEYISVLTSIIIGLGMAHLLRGVAGLVQHPGREKYYWVHLVWVGYMFFGMVFFWWWEFALAEIEVWLFQDYLFIVFYAVILYLMSAMLFPHDLDDYDGYKDYFLSRRRWFFGLLAAQFLVDIYDTWMKGRDHFESFGTDYFMMSAFYLTISVIGIVSRREMVHAAIAVFAFSYQVVWSFTFWGQQG